MRSTMEKEDKGTMIYSATGCSETSVRRQERDYEATNMCRAEHSVRAVTVWREAVRDKQLTLNQY